MVLTLFSSFVPRPFQTSLMALGLASVFADYVVPTFYGDLRSYHCGPFLMLVLDDVHHDAATLQQGRNAGELTEFIAKVANDISDNGELDTQSLKNAILASSSEIDPLGVRKNLIERYKALGHSNVEVPDFYDYLDSDGDGQLNGNTPYLRLDTDYYEVSAQGQSLEILYASNANLTLDIPLGNNWLRKDAQKSTNNKLVLTIDQNTQIQDRSVNITLHTSDNALYETITVYQKLDGVKFAIGLNVGGTRSRASTGGDVTNDRPLIENLSNVTLLCFDQSGKMLFTK